MSAARVLGFSITLFSFFVFFQIQMQQQFLCPSQTATSMSKTLSKSTKSAPTAIPVLHHLMISEIMLTKAEEVRRDPYRH